MSIRDLLGAAFWPLLDDYVFLLKMKLIFIES